MSREYKVKAAFIYRLIYFTQWTESRINQGDNIDICILGENHFGYVLEELEKRHIEDKSISISYFDSFSHQAELRNCNVLFISNFNSKNYADILAFINGQSMLTISENLTDPDTVMINFHFKHNRIVFDINRNLADQANIKFNANLLDIANNVIGGN